MGEGWTNQCKGAKLMNRKVGFITLLVFLLLLSSCQKTPTKEVVINKNDGKLEEIISAEAIDSEQTNIVNQADNTMVETADKFEPGVLSERWTDICRIQGLDCVIDAEIILPHKKEFPVYKIERREFIDQTTQNVLEYFIKDATGVRKTSLTKEELEMKLVLAKRGRYTEVDGVVTWEPYEHQQEDIARLEEQIKNAEEEVFLPVTDDFVLPKADTYEMPDGSRVHVRADSKRFSIRPLKYGIVQPESWVIEGDAYPGEPVGTTLGSVKISQQEAYEMVETFLEEVGIENMGIAEAEKARLLVDITYKTISEGWQVMLSRNDGDSVPVYIDNQPSGVLYNPAEEYIQRWYPEAIRIYVDETGVKTFEWAYPVEVVEVLNENVLVLDFDTIKKRALEYVKFGFSYKVQRLKEENIELPDQKIEVYKIVLTNVMIPIKDDPEYQMLAPAWIIYYSEQIGVATRSSFIVVNAIDGSSIDLKVRKP